MNRLEQQNTFHEIMEFAAKILLTKGDDYALDEDRLHNFKASGSIAGISPEVQCLSLIATKVSRLGVLLNTDKPIRNESVYDSMIDLLNYSILLLMLYKENAKTGVSSNAEDISEGYTYTSQVDMGCKVTDERKELIRRTAEAVESARREVENRKKKETIVGSDYLPNSEKESTLEEKMKRMAYYREEAQKLEDTLYIKAIDSIRLEKPNLFKYDDEQAERASISQSKKPKPDGYGV